MKQRMQVNLGFLNVLLPFITTGLSFYAQYQMQKPPKVSITSIPGTVPVLEEISPQIKAELKRQEEQLKALYEKELELKRLEERLKKEIQTKEKIKSFLKKSAPFIAVSSALLIGYLIFKKK